MPRVRTITKSLQGGFLLGLAIVPGNEPNGHDSPMRINIEVV
jgi:hypothetical protein